MWELRVFVCNEGSIETESSEGIEGFLGFEWYVGNEGSVETESSSGTEGSV